MGKWNNTGLRCCFYTAAGVVAGRSALSRPGTKNADRSAAYVTRGIRSVKKSILMVIYAVVLLEMRFFVIILHSFCHFSQQTLLEKIYLASLKDNLVRETKLLMLKMINRNWVVNHYKRKRKAFTALFLYCQNLSSGCPWPGATVA